MKVFSKRWGNMTVVKGEYFNNGRIAVKLVDGSDMTIAVLTTNIPEANLKDSEFLVKTWSENAEIAADCLASGHFVDTGARIPTGYCDAQVWRFTDEFETEDK